MKKRIIRSYECLKYKKTDILKISDYVFKTYSNLKSEHKRFRIVIDCEKNETLEFEDDSLSNNREILDDKKIYSLRIFYTDFRHDKDITISIAEGAHKTIVEIESGDKEWVDSKIAGIEEIINSVQPQNTLYKKYKLILFHYLSITVGFTTLNFFIKTLDRLGYQGSNSTNTLESNPYLYILDKLLDAFPISKYILLFLFYWAVGAWLIYPFWHKLDIYLESIWPSVEFCFEPEHKQYPNEQRKAWIVILSWILIPLVFLILSK